MSGLDAIELTVIQAGLQQVCDEMDTTFSRAAFSPIIAEADDRSDGLCDAGDGALIAQGLGGLPVSVGTMQESCATLIAMIREGRVAPPEEGDVYAVNDPYLGGTHLMDVRFAAPMWRGAGSSAGSPTWVTGPTEVSHQPVGDERRRPPWGSAGEAGGFTPDTESFEAMVAGGLGGAAATGGGDEAVAHRRMHGDEALQATG